MAYIDIKTETADFRIILVGHGNPIDPCQLQDHCTGVLLEANFTEDDEELPFLFVENSPKINWKTRLQNGGLIAEAKKRRVAIATVQSPFVIGGTVKLKELIGQYTGPYKAAAEIATSASKLENDHPLIQALLVEVENNLSVNPFSPNPYREVMMAQSACFLASLQVGQGLDPFLSMVIGALHIRTNAALRMTEEERLGILKAKFDGKIFSKKKLGNIYYIEYDPTEDKYVRKFFEGRLGENI